MNEQQGNVLFPIFVKLHEIETLLIGGGYVGLEKLEALLRNSPDARITICAKEILQDNIRRLADQHSGVTIIEKPFRKKYLKGKDVVIMATDSRKLHEKVKKLCRKRHILANVADTPDLCDFYLASVMKKGDLKIAISSNGKSPTLTKRIRAYLEEAIPEDVQSVLDRLQEIRSRLKGDFEYKVKELNKVTESWLGSGDVNRPAIGTGRFVLATSKIDSINSGDPKKDESGIPEELLYSKRMSEVLEIFDPSASELLKLAARGQHIKRWSIPRESYPNDRKGYLQWRTELKQMHGKLVSEIMVESGYSNEEAEKVNNMLLKKKLKQDEDVQTLEDVICLVFLQYYFDDFIVKHAEEEQKIISILQKTWNKMSSNGHEAALKLDLSGKASGLISRALNPTSE